MSKIEECIRNGLVPVVCELELAKLHNRRPDLERSVKSMVETVEKQLKLMGVVK